MVTWVPAVLVVVIAAAAARVSTLPPASGRLHRQTGEHETDDGRAEQHRDYGQDDAATARGPADYDLGVSRIAPTAMARPTLAGSVRAGLLAGRSSGAMPLDVRSRTHLHTGPRRCEPTRPTVQVGEAWTAARPTWSALGCTRIASGSSAHKRTAVEKARPA